MFKKGTNHGKELISCYISRYAVLDDSVMFVIILLYIQSKQKCRNRLKINFGIQKNLLWFEEVRILYKSVEKYRKKYFLLQRPARILFGQHEYYSEFKEFFDTSVHATHTSAVGIGRLRAFERDL